MQILQRTKQKTNKKARGHMQEKDSTCTVRMYWRCECLKPFWYQFQKGVSSGTTVNVLGSLIIIIVLFGHDTELESDEIIDWTLILTRFVISAVQNW